MTILKLNSPFSFFWSSKIELDEDKLIFEIDDTKLKATKINSLLYKSDEYTPTSKGTFILKVIYDDTLLKSIPFKVKEFSFEDLIDFQAGNWEIKDKQMIFYDLDGNELARFNLYNKFGQLSDTSIFKREKLE